MAKFKVGDRVRVIDDDYNHHLVHTKGFTGTVVREGSFLIEVHFRKHQEGMHSNGKYKNCQAYQEHKIELASK
jgi:hypothetical protein